MRSTAIPILEVTKVIESSSLRAHAYLYGIKWSFDSTTTRLSHILNEVRTTKRKLDGHQGVSFRGERRKRRKQNYAAKNALRRQRHWSRKNKTPIVLGIGTSHRRAQNKFLWGTLQTELDTLVIDWPPPRAAALAPPRAGVARSAVNASTDTHCVASSSDLKRHILLPLSKVYYPTAIIERKAGNIFRYVLSMFIHKTNS